MITKTQALNMMMKNQSDLCNQIEIEITKAASMDSTSCTVTAERNNAMLTLLREHGFAAAYIGNQYFISWKNSTSEELLNTLKSKP